MTNREAPARQGSMALALWLAALNAYADGPARPPESAPAPRPLVASVLSQEIGRDGRLRFRIEVQSLVDQAPTISVLVDGAPASGVTVDFTDIAGQLVYAVTASPPPGAAVYSVVASAGALRSEPVFVRLRRLGGKLVIDERPALHILAIGVGPYRDKRIPALHFPPKDARDLIATFGAQRDDLFREVESRLLVDEQASREGIEAGMRWLAERARPGDTAVLFLAGHGTNGTDDNYHFLPWDAQLGQEGTLYAGSALERALGEIRGNVVALLDTCHSGNVLGRSSFENLVAKLLRGQNVIVIAAARGDQTSLESPAWGNGAFTLALVEGLRGRSDFIEDGHLMASELEGWLGARVGQLTGGTQTPTFARPRAEADLALAALPRTGVLPGPKQALRRRVYWGLGTAGLVLGVVGVTLAITHPWDLPQSVSVSFNSTR